MLLNKKWLKLSSETNLITDLLGSVKDCMQLFSFYFLPLISLIVIKKERASAKL